MNITANITKYKYFCDNICGSANHIRSAVSMIMSLITEEAAEALEIGWVSALDPPDRDVSIYTVQITAGYSLICRDLEEDEKETSFSFMGVLFTNAEMKND